MATSTVVGHSGRLVCTCNYSGDMKAQLVEEIVLPCVPRSSQKPDSVLTISHPVIVCGKIEGFSKWLQPLLPFCNSNPLFASKFALVDLISPFSSLHSRYFYSSPYGQQLLSLISSTKSMTGGKILSKHCVCVQYLSRHRKKI